VLGNGALLVTLSARGELERMFWPHVDHGQHLGELRIGIVVDGVTRWLDGEPWEHEQSMDDGALVLRTVARAQGCEVEIVDLVHPVAPALIRRIRCAGSFRVVVYCRPDIDESRFGSAAYVDRGHLACYRHGRAFAAGLSAAGDAACGRSRRDEVYSAFDDALDGHLDGDHVAHRGTEGALVADACDEVVLAVAFAESPETKTAGAAPSSGRSRARRGSGCSRSRCTRTERPRGCCHSRGATRCCSSPLVPSLRRFAASQRAWPRRRSAPEAGPIRASGGQVLLGPRSDLRRLLGRCRAEPLDQLLNVPKLLLEVLLVGLQPLEPLLAIREAAAAEAAPPEAVTAISA
jgi:hypothetical protein